MQLGLRTVTQSLEKKVEAKMKEKKSVQNTREEFSIEFGDVNGIKLYEVLQANQDNKKSPKKK
jgi:hypothetical protein